MTGSVAASARGRLKRLGAAAYHSGGLGAAHRLRNSETLTVAMFHRVLPAGEARFAAANRTWTVSLELFEDCLNFFGRHYNVVSCEQVLRASCPQPVGEPLPPRALLISFDDGWADNETYALSALLRRDMKAVVFMVAGAVAGDECWQEPLLRALGEGSLSEASLRRAWAFVTGEPFPVQAGSGNHAIVLALAGLPQAERMQVIGQLPVSAPERDAMLTPGQLRALEAAGVEIESHGATHLPLALLADAVTELRESRNILSSLTAKPVRALSFPHGSYSSKVVVQAYEAGYRLLFTSQAIINECPGGRPAATVLGRIPIISSEIANHRGRLQPDRLARWLFFRQKAAIQVPESI